MLVMGHDVTIAMACASGNLELNPFLPLVAHCLLDSIDMLGQACDILRRFCVEGIEADVDRCRQYVDTSTAAATALVPVLGYEGASALAHRALRAGRTIREQVVLEHILPAEDFDALLSAEAVCRLGQPDIEQPSPAEPGESKTEQIS
jgi:aspartate ammonia-lyase